jgi:hypothetical protein
VSARNPDPKAMKFVGEFLIPRYRGGDENKTDGWTYHPIPDDVLQFAEFYKLVQRMWSLLTSGNCVTLTIDKGDLTKNDTWKSVRVNSRLENLTAHPRKHKNGLQQFAENEENK